MQQLAYEEQLEEEKRRLNRRNVNNGLQNQYALKQPAPNNNAAQMKMNMKHGINKKAMDPIAENGDQKKRRRRRRDDDASDSD